MTLDEIRNKLNDCWRAIDGEANAQREHHAAHGQLCEIYRKFDEHDRLLADRVLVEWLDSPRGAQRFDARRLIKEFHVVAAIPTLEEQAACLATEGTPLAANELSFVQATIRAIKLR